MPASAQLSTGHTTGALAMRALSVSKSFGGVAALSDFDMSIRPGEVHALVGENGSGKSTFIRSLAGYYRADSGTIEVNGRELARGSASGARAAGCRFVHQDLGLIESLSVADNLFLDARFPTRFATIRRAEVRDRVGELLGRVGLDVDPRRTVESLSQAQRTAVAVARAIRSDPASPAHLLVLDEPTATLPADEVSMLVDLVRRVAASGVGILYVSHRLEEIFEVCETVTVLRDGRRQATVPTQALTRAKLIHLVVGAVLESVDASLHTVASPTDSPPRLVVDHVTTEALHDVSFAARAGEVIGIAGITGSGRESILGTVFQGDSSDGGSVTIDGEKVSRGSPRASMSKGIAYLPPDRKLLGGFMDLSARHNMTIAQLSSVWRKGWLRDSAERKDAERWFNELAIRPAGAVDASLRSFSGGNQQKILIAKWLRRPMRVFLLDEPTQGVDVGAKAELHRQLTAVAQRGVAVVISSSDVEELAAVCSCVLILSGGEIVARLEGNRISATTISAESMRARKGES